MLLVFFLSFTQTYHRRGVVLYCVVLCYYVGFTLTNQGGNTKKQQLFFANLNITMTILVIQSIQPTFNLLPTKL